MAKDVPHPVAQLIPDPCDAAVRGAAVGARVATVLDERHRSADRTQDMVVGPVDGAIEAIGQVFGGLRHIWFGERNET